MLRPYGQRSLPWKNKKLAPKFYGSHKMTESIGKVAYRLDLPSNASIHNVFHISQLKLKLGQTHKVQHLPPALTEEFELQMIPETVLGVRWSSELEAYEWLVKRKGCLESEATWESTYLMNQKVQFELSGIVSALIIYT